MNAKICAAKHRKSRYFYCQRRTQIPQADIYYRVFKKELDDLESVALQDSMASVHKQSVQSSIKGIAKKV